MKFNWNLLILAVLLALGLYMWFAHPDSDTLTEDERNNRRLCRNVGLFLICLSLILGLYFYSTGGLKFSANMPGACDTCKYYVQRHRGLRPYSRDEYKLLQSHTNACNQCSKECTEQFQWAQSQGYKQVAEDIRGPCMDTTKHAMLAKKELDRLASKMRASQVAVWKGVTDITGKAPEWDPFPQVPK